NAHNDFLEEIAKFRAARRLWARMMRDRFGATTARAQQLRFHTQTAGSTLTPQQPDNNVVRVAVQALAAALGGPQSLHCNGRAQVAIDSGESVVVGVNRFTEKETTRPVFRMNPEVEQDQIERVRTLKASRDGVETVRSLSAVSEAALSGANLVPPIIAAVEAK